MNESPPSIEAVSASVAGEMDTISLRHSLGDRKSTRLNSSHLGISYAVFCVKKQGCTDTPRRGGGRLVAGGRTLPPLAVAGAPPASAQGARVHAAPGPVDSACGAGRADERHA